MQLYIQHFQLVLLTQLFLSGDYRMTLFHHLTSELLS